MIEVIAVLVILGILAVVVVSRGMSGQETLIAEVDAVKTHLRFAQIKALADDTPGISGWGISFAGGSYTLTRDGASAGISLPGRDSGTYTFPDGIAAGTGDVVFDSWGSPGASPLTVTVTKGDPLDPVDSRTITITAHTGYIP